ncbi:MAG: hypothetical protein C5B55_08375 [Blastocatellia bacterium]|nr:MAG: hypothetical protein C5B55_08375 [Blastocatellia bacterium]
MNDSNSRATSEASQRPRSPRVPVEFDLQVEGKDIHGNAFNQSGKATKISRGGATIIVDVEMKLGSVVKLVPPFGSKLDAEVNGSWTDDLDGQRRIGVKLLNADGWFAD